MSFDKATLKRFNDTTSCAPPPTKYNPKLPHGSVRDINFGNYTGRPQATKQNNEPVFLTPAKPSRGRQLVIGSASTRSLSDTRLRKIKGITSESTRSIHEIPFAASLTPGGDSDVKMQRDKEKENQNLVEKLQMLQNELDLAGEKILHLEKSLASEMQTHKDLEENQQRLTEELEMVGALYKSIRTEYDSIKCQLEDVSKALQNKQLEMMTLENEKEKSVLEKENLVSEKETLEQVCSSLRSDLDSLKCTYEGIQAELTVLKSELDTAVKGKEEKDLELEAKKTEQQELQQSVEMYKVELDSMKQRNEVLQNEHTSLQTQLEFINMELDTKESRLGMLSENIQHLNATCESLQSEKKTMEKCYEDAKVELTSKYDDLAKEMAQKAQELEATKSDKESLLKTIEFLESEKQQLIYGYEEIKIEMANELAQKTQQLEATKSDKDSLLKTIEFLESEKQQLDNGYEEIKKEMENELAQKTQELEATKSNEEYLLKTVEFLESEKTNLINGYEEKKKEIVEIRSLYDVTQAEYMAVQNQFLIAKQELERNDQTITDLNAQLKMSDEYRQSEKQVFLEQIEQLKQQISLQKSSYDNLVEENAVAFEKLVLEKENLLSEKKRLEQVGSSLRSDLDSFKSTNEGIQAELTVLKSELDAAVKSMEEKDRELEATKAEQQQLQQSIEMYKVELDSMKQRNEVLQNEHTSLMTQLEFINMELDTKESRLGMMTEKIDRLTATCESLQCEKKTMEKCYEDAKVELTSKYDDLAKEMAQKTQELEATKSDKESLLKTIEFLESEKQQLINGYEELKKQIVEIRSSYDITQAEYMAVQNQFIIAKQELKRNDQTISNLNAQLKMSDEYRQSEKQMFLEQKEQLKRQISLQKSSYDNLVEANAVALEKMSASEIEREEQAALIKSLCEQLDKYNEKNIENLEAQLRDLRLENDSLKQNMAHYERVYGDYASLVGHQNTRQKIHHVVKIKDENLKLRDEITHLRQKNADLTERLKQVSSGSSGTARRFDPSQAFKLPLKEPVIRDARDVRGPDARGTFTVSRGSHPKPTVRIVDTSKKESKQGMSFDVTFSENKEN